MVDPVQAESHLEVFIRQRAFLAEHHPVWFQEFEDIDPFIADRSAVEDLIRRAPNEFSSGMLCGILMFRQQLAAMTGRDF